MQRSLIPPHDPQREPVRPPMIYVERQTKWEYRQIVRDLQNDALLDEAELNKLGEEGWELAGIAQQPPQAYYYFKRLVEK